jgi:hypothetical protein
MSDLGEVPKAEGVGLWGRNLSSLIVFNEQYLRGHYVHA